MPGINRRNFLKTSGLSVLPALIPAGLALGAETKARGVPPRSTIKFFGDADLLEPGDYIQELQKIQSASPIISDRYGYGGAVEALEKKFCEITGKEKAVFMPSGTMANQLAMAVLSGDKSKIYVQDTSHIYRDEADAAQTVFQKRLVPLAKNETCFTQKELQEAIEDLKTEEVFATGIGAVAIENPVRRTLGKMVSIDEIGKISAYCHSNKIALHLDGARLFIAAAWSGIPVKEYSSHFDTVYISLYKYLGAASGAILCGDKEVIEKMPHLMKIHGGSMFSNWANAAMALYKLETIESLLQEVMKRADAVFAGLNKISGLRVTSIPDGTNIYTLGLSTKIDIAKMRDTLHKNYSIRIPAADRQNRILLTVNETLLYQPPEYVVNAFRSSI